MTEEEVLDGVLARGEACIWMDEYDERDTCFERTKGGFVPLLGEDSANAVNAAFCVASQLPSDDKAIVRCTA